MKRCITFKNKRLRALNRELYGEAGLPPQTEHITIDGHDVVQVTFDRDQAWQVFERARDKVKGAIKAGAKNFGNTDPKFLLQSNFDGFLGQVAWYIYAENDFPMGLETLKIGFVPDQQDFIYKGYKGDVKTAMRVNAKTMNIPEERFQKALQYNRFDMYVGCKCIESAELPYGKIQIWGYVMCSEVENNGYVTEGWRRYPFLWMHPIVELKDLKPKIELKS